MSERIEPFTVTVPAGTAVASFQRTDLSFPDGRVDRLEILVPPGPSGLVGFRIAHSGQSVIPNTGERWFVVDDQRLDWDLDSYPVRNAWELWAYNTDVYDHTLYLWFHVTELQASAPSFVAPLRIVSTGSAEDFGTSDQEVA